MLQEGKLGVHPPGSLGVAFFVHAKGDCFIGRTGDGITDVLKKTGSLRLDEGGKMRAIALRQRVFSNLLEADARGHLPELLFVCCNPDQLGLYTGELTRFLENLAQRSRLKSIDDVASQVPISLVLPNGILAEQTVQTYEQQLRESMLMGRLEGVTQDMIAALLDRVVRGISLQAGGRRGTGADTTYILEAKGSLIFAGGGQPERRRIEAILSDHGYRFNHARDVPGTRIEFDKAMISTVLNVGGLIHTVKPSGELIDLRMGDLCQDPTKAEFVDRVTRAVFEVGRSAGAYTDDDVYEDIWQAHRETIFSVAGHVTSSLKTFGEALSRGLSDVKLFSNEEWILTPLCRYAARAGLTEHEELFRSLGRQVQDAMARAIRFREQGAGENGSRINPMKLAAQRNFNIELYDAGAGNMLLVGTMLDDEHLLKLELNVFLPDEQITRARLDMIRAPFPVCREVEAVADCLVGLRIERGVIHEITRRIGGRAGCSHIKELAANIVYFVASHLVRRRAGVDPLSTDYVFRLPEERFTLTKELLRDSCLAYCQTTPMGLDERIGIKRVGAEHSHPVPLGTYEPSLGVLLRDRARRFGDKTYLRYRHDEQVQALSWTDFAQSTFRIAANLLARGAGPGDRIAMISENRAEMYLFELAAMSIGAVSVPIFAGYPPPQLAYVLGHARPSRVVVSGMHQLAKIESSRHPWVQQYFCMDFDDDAKAWGALDFGELTGDGGVSPAVVDRHIDAVRPGDLCTIMYTSGTTGPPKGVQLCHRNLISQQKAVSLIWDVDEKDVLMSYLPWHHSFGGLFERYLTLYHGCELCLDDSRGRNLDRLLENWKAYDPSLFFSVPRVHDLLITRCREDSAAAEVVFGGRLRFVFTAGASLPAHVEAGYSGRNIPVLEGWGLTETSPSVTLRAKDSTWRSGYVGIPIPGVTIRIDGDQEILVKGPNVMLGYLDDEEGTAHVLDKDGWFHSGDLGEFTPEGLRIFGRRDGAFKLTTGEKVHPQRIENLLVNESPYIGGAMVVGSAEDFVAALIVPDFSRLGEWAREQGLDTEDLIDHPKVRQLFASELQRLNPRIEVKYHRVRRAVLAEDAPSLERGELTPSGKLVRKAVAANHKDKLDGLYLARPSQDVIEVPNVKLQESYAGTN